MMNPQWLHTFVAIAELGSFTRAADRLGLTQAAVSQHVRHLEGELGTLILRRPRQLELTPAGTMFLAYCNEIEQADNRLKVRLSDADACSGEFSLITPGSVGLALYPILLSMQQGNRNLTIRHRFAPDREALEAVLQKEYELGLVTLKPDDARIAAQPFAEEPLELVIPAGEKVESWADLHRMGFIDHPDGQGMATRLLSRHFPSNPGIRTVPRHGYINQIGQMLEPVARGLGFTVIPRYAREAFPQPEAIKVLACGSPVVDTLWLIHRSEWPLSSRARCVIDHLKQHLPVIARGSENAATQSSSDAVMPQRKSEAAQ